MICQRRDDLEACVAQWAIYARECPVSRANLGRQLFAAARYRGPRNPPTQDTLILNAQGDQLVNPGCSSSIARHWGVPLKTHPWAGHDLTHDAPEWVIDRLANPLPDMN
ncbi:MAG: hypothetical protein GYB21_04105 [Oceanospirillales bacterium]|nr:hypothetical protein [Oceanospirillales bacterium]